MADLPLILAGPVLRRVTPRQVSVWIALSREAEVKLSIWDQEVNTGAGFEIFDEGSIPLKHTSTKKTARIGQNLYIAVVVISLEPPEGEPPLPSLIPGKLYSYNLSFNISGQPASDLKSSKLLINSESVENYYGTETDATGKFFLKNGIRFNLQTEDAKVFFQEGDTKNFLDPLVNLALGYRPGFLPTFVIPPIGLDSLNIVHGSCRNPAGYGKDSLAALDFRIKASLDEIEKRPHQVYFTGDQIYADIIPVRMMGNLTRLGNELIGFNEKIIVKPGTAAEEAVVFEVTEQNFPVQRRKKLIHKTANLTPKADTEGFSINHLLSFGEYAATYILYWSNAAWHVELFIEEEAMKKREDYLSVWEIISPANDIIDTIDITGLNEEEKEKKLKSKKEKSKEQYDDELPHFIEFRKKLPFVMRALANIPVYMIFDDHDITDDWNINKAWRNAVLTSAMGSSVIRNALMAYTLFQDWGNDPLQYEKAGSKKILLEKLQLIFPDRTNITTPDDIALSELEAGAFASEVSTLFGLDLVDETPPPVKWHYAVPCGEITIYALDTRTRRTFETIDAPPGLLSDSAMDDQIPIAVQPDKVVIFISPAPVFSPAILEELLQPAMLMGDAFSEDPEPWAFCPPVFEKFLNRIQQFKKVVFFSGDIHQGMTLTLDYWKKDESTPSRMVQLISSSLKQKKFAEVQFLASGFVQEVFGSLMYPLERLGYNSNAFLQVTNPNGIPNRPKHRIRLRKEPVLLPTKGWPKDSVVSRNGVPNEVPDWAWRIEFIKDERPDDESAEARPEKIRLPLIDPDVDATNPGKEGYRKILLRHQEAFRHSIARRDVFNSNIGLVNFRTDVNGNVVEVIHGLLFWLEDDEDTDDPDVYVLHKASLQASTAQQPGSPIVNF